MAIVGCLWRVLIAVHGGVKVYWGAAAAARDYVQADRGRADDHYLAEGIGIAERWTASQAGVVTREAPLTGDSYEAWVAGLHPETGEPKGRLRHDAQAVRFVEVSVNGPKSWSLAAELHPAISVAYDAAQDAAAQQIIGWSAQHATTRVGPRGGQIQSSGHRARGHKSATMTFDQHGYLFDDRLDDVADRLDAAVDAFVLSNSEARGNVRSLPT
jgi:hypothetical protein